MPNPLLHVLRLQTQRCFSAPHSGPAQAGDSCFQGKVWVHTPLTLNTVYKTAMEYFFPDTESRKQQNYKLGEMKTNYCMQDTTSEAGEGKYMQTFLASAKDQPNLQSWSLLSFSLGVFFVILLENHSWLPIVWDISESDLEYVNVMRITTTNLGGTLYAAQVHLGLQASWIWICFLILMLLLVLSGTYATTLFTAIIAVTTLTIFSLSDLIYLWKTSFLIKVLKSCCQGLWNLRIWFKLPEQGIHDHIEIPVSSFQHQSAIISL